MVPYQQLLDVFAFSRFSAFLGWPPEETAEALADAGGYALRREAARLLAEQAVAERVRVDTWTGRLMDRLAVHCEHDLGHLVDVPVLPPADIIDGPVSAETQVRQAFRAATAFHEALGVGEAEVVALVHGAFLIEEMHALLVAQAVLAQVSATS
jgi:hypothetical protein